MADSTQTRELSRLNPVPGLRAPTPGPALPDGDTGESSGNGRRDDLAREAMLLHDIALAAAGEEDLGRILSGALDLLRGAISFTGGSISLVEDEELVLRAAVGPFAAEALGQRLPRGNGQSWRIVESGQPWRTDDLHAAGFRIRGVEPDSGPRSYLAVPLIRQGEPIGLLQIDSTAPGAFSDHDVKLMEAVGVALTGPIELARRYEREATALAESERATARLRLLAEASALLGASLDYETTLRNVAEIAVPALADWCVIDIVERDGTLRRLAVAHADRQRELAEELLRRYPARDPSQSPFLQSVLDTGKSILLPDVSDAVLEHIAETPEQLELMRKLELRSGMLVPLPGHERVLGAIAFVSTRPERRYGDVDLATAEEIGARAGAAVERARLHGELSRFRSTVDSVLDGVLMFDPASLRFFYANEGAVRLTGYGRDELLTMTPLDLEPGIDEARFRRLIEPLIENASTTTIGTTYRRKDGRTSTVELFMQYVAPVGEHGRLVTVVRDITERIEARARLQRLAQSERARNAELRAIIRAMGDAVLVIDQSGRINLANPAAETFFADAPIARYDELAARLENPDGDVPDLERLPEAGPIEVRFVGGDERWLELSAYPVLTPRESFEDDGEGDIIETIVFIRDTTDIRRSRTMRDAFVGVLSHELRTPVTTIYGNSKLLTRRESRMQEQTRHEILADIEGEAERLYRLVEDLLVLARFERAPGRVGREPVLMQRVVPIVIRSERSRFPGVRFESRIDHGLPTVQADPTYVEQVVRNLLSNAAKYGGGKTVDVTVQGAGDEVHVNVLDSGPGFPEEEASRLFDLFYRSPRTSGMAAGAGIGLFVCRRLIEAMGGRMWARPREAGGAEFGFSLRVFTEESE